MTSPRVAAALACALPLLLGGTAWADAPARTGWWNAATVNGTALPRPTTGADDLHISQGPDGPTAYAALVLQVPSGAAGGVLKLAVVDGSAVGTVDVQACPTKDLSWKAGGNQPYAARPEYDCASGAGGVAAADGNAVVFVLDAAQQLAGAYSLAIVPTDGAAPFSVDFTKPGPTAFAPDAPEALGGEPAPAAPPPPPPDDAGPAPPAATTTYEAPPPVSVGEAAPVLAPAPAPVAAAPPVAPVVAYPVAARPLAPVSNRDRYAAGTMLALLAGALVWAGQQPARTPQLIGGAGRGPARSPSVPVADPQPRGIGRFAAVRTAPARRLV